MHYAVLKALLATARTLLTARSILSQFLSFVNIYFIIFFNFCGYGLPTPGEQEGLQRTWDLKLRKTYADPTILKEQNRLEWQECGERGEIERNFGVGKCRCGLDCIVAKLK